MKKNKRSYFKLEEEDKIYKNKYRKLYTYIPKQPKLIKFLIDNKADEGFISALNKASKQTRYRVFNSEDILGSICYSFNWSSTAEGQNYWDKLNDDFNKIIRGDNE